MEKAKYPMPTMDITQGYNVGSHLGAYALDMAGEDSGIDWVLAPFTGTIKQAASKSYGNWYWFESNEPVLCANGEITKLVMMIGHDNKLRHKVGTIIKQGEHLCAEGTSGNANGNHCHMELAKGEYTKMWIENEYGVFEIPNKIKPNEYLCVPDDYVIKNNGGYEWKKESEVNIPQPQPSSNIQYLNLSPKADTWRVYTMNVAPVVGNECKILYPSKFGGLSYTLKGYTQTNVAIIETRDYGQVQIYIGQDVANMFSITDSPVYGLVK